MGASYRRPCAEPLGRWSRRHHLRMKSDTLTYLACTAGPSMAEQESDSDAAGVGVRYAVVKRDNALGTGVYSASGQILEAACWSKEALRPELSCLGPWLQEGE